MKLTDAIAAAAAGKLTRAVLTEAGWYTPRPVDATAVEDAPLPAPVPAAVAPIVEEAPLPGIIRRKPGRPRKVRPITIAGPEDFYGR